LHFDRARGLALALGEPSSRLLHRASGHREPRIRFAPAVGRLCRPQGDMAEPPLWQALVAGVSGGVCNVLVGHPFDTIKVRAQADRPLFEGSLLTGIVGQLVGVAPFWMFFYFSYKLGRSLQPDSGLVSLTRAGMIAGALSSLVYCPVQGVKCIAQADKVSSGAALRQLTSNFRNPLGIYRGLLPTLAYTVPAQAAFYLSFEVAVARLPPVFAGLWRQLVAGGLAGIVEFTVGMPMDTLKTRCQISTASGSAGGVLSVLGQLWREEGIAGFYRGYKWAVLRAFPANGAAMVGIEVVNRLLARATTVA
jgi:solute carrier family 25 carnitine/acylcarnitine transporter 20/29